MKHRMPQRRRAETLPGLFSPAPHEDRSHPRSQTDGDPLPDDALIRRVVAGEADLFEQLIVRHKSHVSRIVAGHVPRDMVEEVAHDVFVRAYLSLATYSFRQPFPHWLATIAVRTCYDVWRGIGARKEIPIGGTDQDHREWT